MSRVKGKSEEEEKEKKRVARVRQGFSGPGPKHRLRH